MLFHVMAALYLKLFGRALGALIRIKKKKSDDSLVTTHLTERHSWIFHSSTDYFFRETGSICDRVVCWRRFRGGQRGTRRSGETTKKKEIKMKESKLPSKIRRMQLWMRII